MGKRINLSAGAQHHNEPLAETVPVNCRIDKALRQLMSEVLACEGLSYRTLSDIMRAALEHFMRYEVAPKMHKDFNSAIQQRALCLRVVERKARLFDASKFAQAVRDAICDLLIEQELDEAARAYRDTVRMLKKQPPDFARRVRGHLESDPKLAPARERVPSLHSEGVVDDDGEPLPPGHPDYE